MSDLIDFDISTQGADYDLVSALKEANEGPTLTGESAGVTAPVSEEFAFNTESATNASVAVERFIENYRKNYIQRITYNSKDPVNVKPINGFLADTIKTSNVLKCTGQIVDDVKEQILFQH
jgi:hypothetical protein